MKTANQYIASFPENVQQMLQQLREAILQTAPNATEGISYAMPAYKLNGKPLVYFAGYKSHIGFYATPTGHEAFAPELAQYKQGKGSVQFPVNEPLPLDLIKRIVLFRVKENEANTSKSKKAKEEHIFDELSAPAQRALAEHNIVGVTQLSTFTEKEILSMHGIGKSSIPKIMALLNSHGLKFKG
ncbi:hypothetical protein GR160_14365 [Flavobacterium sp. Sd200]|nr:hypothetical protein [Flavobacterium sp. Sd200]